MMSTLHEMAKDLLPIVITASIEGKTFSYAEAAQRIGRPRNNGRTVAQVCNLLDAAAAYGGVPLLALTAVTQTNGLINTRAWANTVEERQHRKQIIDRSRNHKFGKDDYRAISDALETLDDMSGRSAWDFVRSRINDHELYRRIAGTEFGAEQPTPKLQARDAIDDIGFDRPSRRLSTSSSYARDDNVRETVIRRARGKCEYCGPVGFLSKRTSAGRRRFWSKK